MYQTDRIKLIVLETTLITILLIVQSGCFTARTELFENPRILTIAHENPWLSLDPQIANDSVTWSVLNNLYEPLVAFDSEMRIKGRLAERWENPNDTTWRFYLRPNVIFHNGKLFNSSDVMYTFERAKSERHQGIKPYILSITDVKIIDSLTIDILTDRPDAILLNRLTFLLILPSGEAPDHEIETPIGTGSYQFSKNLPNGAILMKANQKYWAGTPAISEVAFAAFETEAEMTGALMKGKAHLIRNYTEGFIEKIRSSTCCEVVSQDGLSVSLLGFNLQGDEQTNLLKRRAVREALHYAIDKTRIVNEVLNGRAHPASQLVSPFVFGFDPSFAQVLPDSRKALNLLKKAGVPSDYRFEIYGADESRLHHVVKQLQLAGISAFAHVLPYSEIYRKSIQHELPIYTLSWSCSMGDASDFLENVLHSPKKEIGYGGFNVADYRNPEVDLLIQQSRAVLTISDRKKILQRAISIAMRDLPYLPLYSRHVQYGISKRIDWKPRRDGRLYANEVHWKDAS